MLQQLIKQKTRTYHAALEGAVDIAACLGSPDSWRWLLETFYGYWTPVEARVFAPPGFDAWLPDSGLRRRAALLGRDMEAVGGNPDRVTLCTDLPAADSIAQKFGCLYVMEGSTLGGQFIARLATEKGYTPDRGCAFFASYGNSVGSMWKAFAERLNAYGEAHPGEQDTVAASAIETFVKFQRWFSGRKP